MLPGIRLRVRRWRRRLEEFLAARPGIPRGAIGVGTVVVLTAIMLTYGIHPRRVHLEVGDLSPTGIRAPRSVVYIDPHETERLRRDAAARVGGVYNEVAYARADAEGEVDGIFDKLTAASGSERAVAPDLLNMPGLQDATIRWALRLPAPRLGDLREATRQVLQTAMNQEIQVGVPEDLARARQTVSDEVAALGWDARAQNLVAAIAREAVRPNRKYDPEQTQDKQARAAARVKPVERSLVIGDLVVAKGERVTAKQIAMLRALGLIRQGLDYQTLAATFLLVLLTVLALAAYLFRFQQAVYRQPRSLLLLALVLAMALGTSTLKGPTMENLGMLTVAAGAMVIAVLFNAHLGIASAVATSALVGVMGEGQLGGTLLTLGSALAGVAVVAELWPPSHWVRAIVFLIVANTAMIACWGWLSGDPPRQLLADLGMGGLYGFAAPLLAAGAVLCLQRPFGLTTHIRLLELSNLNEPLLKRLQNEAPGTYGASVIMANLAESGAQAIGADPLLARVGCYYHDVGKLRRPYFFYENQALLGVDNVHDRLAPTISSLSIITHTRDGVELAREYGLPPAIQDIIAQHHGRTLAAYFYHRALNGRKPEKPSEEQFRYPGPRPQTREAAIIMLADQVQAAVMALTNPTATRVAALVDEIVHDRLLEGELDECPLTFRDLTHIKERFRNVLYGIYFHARIEYPEKEEIREKASSGDPH
jgi:putative nucleotidyltransferase with HDIG domain